MIFVLHMLCVTIGIAVSMRVAEWVLLSLWYGVPRVWQEELHLAKFNPVLHVSNGDDLSHRAGLTWLIATLLGGLVLFWPMKHATRRLVPNEYHQSLDRNEIPKDYGAIGFVLSILTIGAAWLFVHRAPWVAAAEWAGAILLIRWDVARRQRAHSLT